MRDLNFFSIYQGSIKERKDDNAYIYITLLALGAVILLTLSISVVRICLINKDIKDIEAQLNAPEVQQKLSEAEELNRKLSVLGNYESSLSDVANSIKANSIVTDEKLNAICGAMPTEISFKEFKVEGYDFTLSGVSKDRKSVSEFEHNLEELNIFKVIHVDKISKENTVGEDYSFEMTCVLKEVE